MKKLNKKNQQLYQKLRLIFRVYDGNATDEELDQYIQFCETNEHLYTKQEPLPPSDNEVVFPQLSLADLEHRIAQHEQAKVIRGRRWWIRSVAAALIVGVGAWAGYHYWINNDFMPDNTIVYADSANLTPAVTNALLLRNDNTAVSLDSTTQGKIGSEGNTELTGSREGLVYNITAGAAYHKTMLNTLSTISQGFYKLVLSDGTQVMLNAQTQIIYPVVFQGPVRKVTLVKGEAYFTVTKNGTPFIVACKDKNISVIGTQFNVDAYGENVIKTTLLKGRIDLEANGRKITMLPGQEAITHLDTDSITVSKPADANVCISWTRGIFDFDGLPVRDIMAELARWYDADIICADDIQLKTINHYGLSRVLPLKLALWDISGHGDHFRYKVDSKDHRTVVVISAP